MYIVQSYFMRVSLKSNYNTQVLKMGHCSLNAYMNWNLNHDEGMYLFTRYLFLLWLVTPGYS